MRRTIKPRHEMNINELIRDSGWFNGTEGDWRKLSSEERREISFAAIGCEVAYPTWERNHCTHLTCRIRRGELPKIAETNWTLRHERSDGWLRFIEDRQKVARIFLTLRNAARVSGIYDPWKIPGGWQALITAGVIE